MSKTQKPCNNRKCSKPKQSSLSEDLNKKFFESLKKNRKVVDHDPEEIYRREEEARRKEEDYLESIWGSYISSPVEEIAKHDESAIQHSNVEIVIGKSTENTEIYVGGTQLKGCLKASLDFDAELGVPTLSITVIGPTVSTLTRKIPISCS